MSNEFGLESLNLMSKFHIQRPLIKVPNFQLSCKETHTNHKNKQTRVQIVVKKKRKKEKKKKKDMIIECKIYPM